MIFDNNGAFMDKKTREYLHSVNNWYIVAEILYKIKNKQIKCSYKNKRSSDLSKLKVGDIRLFTQRNKSMLGVVLDITELSSNNRVVTLYVDAKRLVNLCHDDGLVVYSSVVLPSTVRSELNTVIKNTINRDDYYKFHILDSYLE